MRGTMITIKPNGNATFVPVDKSPDLETLKGGIDGGYLEVVPGWTQFPFENGTMQPCVAFCDEDGKRKRLPINTEATKMWHAMMQQLDTALRYVPDVLVGSVVILTGDEAFMRSLREDEDETE